MKYCACPRSISAKESLSSATSSSSSPGNPPSASSTGKTHSRRWADSNTRRRAGASTTKRLILSDGTATLHFLDPNTYVETGRIEVRDQGRPVDRLNELEFINSSVYANIWHSDRIAIIDPKNGRVTGWIDLSGLWTPPAGEQEDSVLNGIAYLSQTKHLLVTGKCWPRMYEIELIPEPPAPPRP